MFTCLTGQRVILLNNKGYTRCTVIVLFRLTPCLTDQPPVTKADTKIGVFQFSRQLMHSIHSKNGSKCILHRASTYK